MAAREQIDKANAKARELLKAAGIVITEEEAKRIEYCDYRPCVRQGDDADTVSDLSGAPASSIGRLSGEGGNLPLPLGRGLPLCSRGAYGAAAGKSSGASEGAFYRVA